MRRALCVRFPAWPLQRQRRACPALDGEPLALHTPFAGGRGPRVASCCRAARALGIRPGMPLAEAEAVGPRLRLLPHDPASDLAELHRLAGLAGQFAAAVGLEEAAEPAALLLDVDGGALPFGGEEPLVQAAAAAFQAEGYAPRAVLAGCVGAAWALAAFGVHAAAGRVADGPQVAQELACLPLAALRLPPEVAEALQDLGLHRVGQVEALPRAAWPERFGAAVGWRLDQLHGRVPEPIVPWQPPRAWHSRRDFEPPLEDWAYLAAAVQEMLAELADGLGAAWAVSRMAWTLRPEPGHPQPPATAEVEFARPTASVRRLAQLLHARLERLRHDARLAPVQRLDLAAALAPALELPAALWGQADADRGRVWGELVETLSSRLGRDRVGLPAPDGDPLPERAWRVAPALDQVRAEAARSRRPAYRAAKRPPDPPADPPPAPPPRPLRLLPEPQRLEVFPADGTPQRLLWQDEWLDIAQAHGPERLAAGWWRGADAARDYYRLDSFDGRRCWVFRDSAAWFLHGWFD